MSGKEMRLFKGRAAEKIINPEELSANILLAKCLIYLGGADEKGGTSAQKQLRKDICVHFRCLGLEPPKADINLADEDDLSVKEWEGLCDEKRR